MQGTVEVKVARRMIQRQATESVLRMRLDLVWTGGI